MEFNIDPRICRDIGITSCCTDDTNTGLCDVHFRDAQNSRCSCNVSCHLRNDCCTDAASFCVRKYSISNCPLNNVIIIILSKRCLRVQLNLLFFF